MQGICTVCQSQQPISASSRPFDELKELGMEDYEIAMTYLNAIEYVVDSHDCCGEHCEGSGLIPQTVLS